MTDIDPTIDYDQQIAENSEKSRNEINHPSIPKGTNIYGSTKIFPDYKAELRCDVAGHPRPA
jgi:hypothetical protein